MRTPTAAAALAAVVFLAGPPAPAGAAPPSCADLGGTLSDGRTCRVTASSANYTLNLSYPTDYADEQALTDFLSQNRDGFINVAQTSGSRDVPYQMEVTTEQFRSGQPPHGTQSSSPVAITAASTTRVSPAATSAPTAEASAHCPCG